MVIGHRKGQSDRAQFPRIAWIRGAIMSGKGYNFLNPQTGPTGVVITTSSLSRKEGWNRVNLSWKGAKSFARGGSINGID